ncbi:MAG: class I SAM-dependent methyltransferase [Dermatophilaceae bacterium]
MSDRHTDPAGLAVAFDRAAHSYDAMVGLSPGYHEQLGAAGRAAAAALAVSVPQDVASSHVSPHAVVALDLGCGSGASTRALLDALTASTAGPVCVTGVDASAGMLRQAAGKPWPPGVTFVHEDALAFLQAQPDAAADVVLAAYLLRNVPDRDAVLTHVRRVLRPGGVLVVHDYSVAGSRRAQVVWAVVCHLVIVPLSHLKGSDPGLHHYLYDSVRRFDSVAEICVRLSRAGFAGVRHRSYAGWQHGIVHTVVGTAPE